MGILGDYTQRLAGLLRDPQLRSDLSANSRSALSGALRGITAGVLGSPMDMAVMLSRMTGENPKLAQWADSGALPLTSDWFGGYGEKAGLLSPREDNISYKAGEFLGPIAAAGIPRAANGVLNALGDIATHQGQLGQLGMVGYHGTPHRFAPVPDNPLGAFDLSKIGTGEGAQAYGHGIYIAEDPVTGGSYRLAGKTGSRDVFMNGAPIIGDSMYRRALEDVATLGKEKAISNLDRSIGFNESYAPDMANLYRSVKERIAKIDPSQISVDNGNLYHVDLPDEHIANMLDWDKPLSEQAPHIQEAARKLIPGEFASSGAMQDARWGDLASAYDPMQMSGGDFLGRLTSVFGRAGDNPMNASPRASMELNKLGIPGIKYLDAGSRNFVPPRIESGANGHAVYWGNDPIPVGTFKSLEEAQSVARDFDTRTRNFVVFDPKILKILKRE